MKTRKRSRKPMGTGEKVALVGGLLAAAVVAIFIVDPPNFNSIGSGF